MDTRMMLKNSGMCGGGIVCVWVGNNIVVDRDSVVLIECGEMMNPRNYVE